MNALVSVARRVVAFGTVAAVAGLGVLAQAGGYLLGFAEPAAASETPVTEHRALPYASPGDHAVGLRRIGADVAPVDLTVWYPAAGDDLDGPGTRYSYALTVLGGRTATAVATAGGTARLGAAADLSGGPYPLVVLSAGFAITPESYSWLAEHLASHGMVVVAPRHAEPLNPGLLWRSAIDRPRVIAATRAYVESAAATGGELAGLVDPGTVAVIGHSLGGYTALAAAGARVDAHAFTAGCDAARRDADPILFLCDALGPRIDRMAAEAATDPAPVDAVVSLAGDAAMFGEAGLASLTAPLLAIGGTADRDSPFAWSSALAFEGAASDRRVEVALEGAGHFVFTNDCQAARRIVRLAPLGLCEDAAWDRGDARAAVRHYVTAFLQGALAQREEAWAQATRLDAPAGVRVRYAAPGSSA